MVLLVKFSNLYRHSPLKINLLYNNIICSKLNKCLLKQLKSTFENILLPSVALNFPNAVMILSCLLVSIFMYFISYKVVITAIGIGIEQYYMMHMTIL